MAIAVAWQNERGERIRDCPVEWEDRMGRGAILERSHCLQYIDPIGVTTFNQLQLRQLVRELEQAVSQLQSSLFKERAEKVVEFVRGCEGMHTYVIFIGD